MCYTAANEKYFSVSDKRIVCHCGAPSAANVVTSNKDGSIARHTSSCADAERLGDIWRYMEYNQTETLPDVILIDTQPEINWSMRPYLIDFLIEVHSAYELSPDVLFLSVNLLDRYCSRRVVHAEHYQLVGCVALRIASKYDENPGLGPSLSELEDMCCGLYERHVFLQMEIHVLTTLEWAVGHPTAFLFLQHMAAEGQDDDDEVQHMAAYIIEIALYHRDFVSTMPVTMARISSFLARVILGRPQTDGAKLHVDDALTMSLLCTCIFASAPTVAHKYAEPNLSMVSQKLAIFLAHQPAKANSALACTAYASPSIMTGRPNLDVPHRNRAVY